MDFLIITKIEKENPIEGRVTTSTSTNSPEAYRYYLYGQQAFIRSDNSTAAKMYLTALTLDSNFIDLFRKQKNYALSSTIKEDRPVLFKRSILIGYILFSLKHPGNQSII